MQWPYEAPKVIHLSGDPREEAQILRRLIARHKGPFPRSTIVQLWREIVSAMVRIQGELKVAVYAPDGIHTCREMARDHFGAGTPLSLHSSARAVLNSVQDGKATVGILPFPEDGEAAPWWTVLAAMELSVDYRYVLAFRLCQWQLTSRRRSLRGQN